MVAVDCDFGRHGRPRGGQGGDEVRERWATEMTRH